MPDSSRPLGDCHPPAPWEPLVSHALWYAAQGLHVFPLSPGAKVPLISKAEGGRGCLDGTTDPRRIAAWWAAEPDAGIGAHLGAGGLIALDLDRKAGKDGVAALEGLELCHGPLPQTWAQDTPSGGRHLIFRLPEGVKHGLVVPQDWKGLGIDIRSTGGYVALAPTATVEGPRTDAGTYLLDTSAGIATAPDWVCEALAAPAAPDRTTSAATGVPVSVEHMERDILPGLDPGMDYNEWVRIVGAIKNTPIIGEPEGDDSFRFALALKWSSGQYSNGGVEPDKFTGEDDVRRAFDTLKRTEGSTTNYGTLRAESGYKGPPGGVDDLRATFADAVAIASEHDPEPATVARWAQPKDIDEIYDTRAKSLQWLLPGFVMRGTLNLLSGRGGVGKGRLALLWGAAIATATDLWGNKTEQATLVHLSYEDDADEMRRRHQALAKAGFPRIPADKIRYFDFTDPDVCQDPLYVVEEDGTITRTGQHAMLVDALASVAGHKLLFGDSAYNVIQFRGNSKISEDAVNRAIRTLNEDCKLHGWTWLMVIHPSQAATARKDAIGWSEAFTNATRNVLKLTCDDDTRPDVLTLAVAKINSAARGKPVTLHIGPDGILRPRADVVNVERERKFREVVVQIACEQAANGAPIQRQKGLPDYLVRQIEGVIGRRPSNREIKEVLAECEGKELRYVKGFGKIAAGYRPFLTAEDYEALSPEDMQRSPDWNALIAARKRAAPPDTG